MARTFTREEFYELVWSKPLTQLAKEFFLSDVALHKICKKHNIPHPPAGWWAKKSAGKDVIVAPLPPKEDGASGQITISSGQLTKEPKHLAEAREEARIVASSGIDGTVPASPFITRTIEALRKAKPGTRSLIETQGPKLISCAVAVDSVERVHGILLRVLAATSLHGFEIIAGENACEFRRSDVCVGFSIFEEVKRAKHIPTEAEDAALKAWEQKRSRARARGDWDSDWANRPTPPEWEYHPTGKLAFELEQSHFLNSSPRRAFKDAKVQRLEDIIDQIAVGLVVVATAKAQDQLDRAERQRQQDEETRRRQAAERAEHIEKKRVEALDAVLAHYERVERIRRLIAGLSTDPSADPRVLAFRRWVTEHLSDREEALSSSSLDDYFSRARVFRDDDDHGFWPNRW